MDMYLRMIHGTDCSKGVHLDNTSFSPTYMQNREAMYRPFTPWMKGRSNTGATFIVLHTHCSKGDGSSHLPLAKEKNDGGDESGHFRG